MTMTSTNDTTTTLAPALASQPVLHHGTCTTGMMMTMPTMLTAKCLVSQCCLHCFTDGEDSALSHGQQYLETVSAWCRWMDAANTIRALLFVLSCFDVTHVRSCHSRLWSHCMCSQLIRMQTDDSCSTGLQLAPNCGTSMHSLATHVPFLTSMQSGKYDSVFQIQHQDDSDDDPSTHLSMIMLLNINGNDLTSTTSTRKTAKTTPPPPPQDNNCPTSTTSTKSMATMKPPLSPHGDDKR